MSTCNSLRIKLEIKGDANELFKKIEYEIVINESFSVIRSCKGCGRKTYFKNTKKFRVNANGNRLDVWLIYQCEKCKHTLNLAIYERKKSSFITKEEYIRFLKNDEKLAETYGRNMQLFRKNKAVIDFEKMNYSFVKLHESAEKSNDLKEQIMIKIYNSYELKIRPEKQIAEILGLSRNQVRKMITQEKIKLENISLQLISVYVDNHIFD